MHKSGMIVQITKVRLDVLGDGDVRDMRFVEHL